MNAIITISVIEDAINRARAQQPATGVEASLSYEVAILAGLYGRLIWEHRDGIPLEQLTDAERLALQLWRPAAPLAAVSSSPAMAT